MIAPRWRKIWGDIAAARGRTLMLVIALAAGVFGLSTILSAYSVLTREIAFNYQATHPASATIEMETVSDAVLARVRSRPEIAEVERRAVVPARAQVGLDWQPMLLFVVENFEAIRLNRFQSLSGAWPPPTGTLLIEHTAQRVLRATEGHSVIVKTPQGRPTALAISGLVHDTTLAPAWQEQTGYGYITAETLRLLDQSLGFDELRLQYQDRLSDLAFIEERTQAVASDLRDQGEIIHGLKIPPPQKHPHQTQMQSVLALFIVVAAMALVLSAILVASVLAVMLSRQIREIGIMKAIGARTSQIVWLYVGFVLVLGSAAVAIGAPAGVAASRVLARTIAVDLLNFTLTSFSLPFWVLAAVAGSGVGVPVLVALPTIVRACRRTAGEALADFGVADGAVGGGGLAAFRVSVRGIAIPYRLSIGNMLRRRGRLILVLVLLAAGGAMFMTGLNLRAGWEGFSERINTERHYDFEFRLSEPASIVQVERVLSGIEGIARFELWGYRETAFAREGLFDVARVYPDRSHGSFALYGVAPDTTLIEFPLRNGRWLANDDTDAVVLNQAGLARIPKAKPGDRLTLSIADALTHWTLVGVVEEVGSPPAAYVAASSYGALTGLGTGGEMLRIALARSTDRAAIDRDQVLRRIETALDREGLAVERGLPKSMLRTAMGDHIAVLVSTLILTSGLLAAIGGLGLASSMAINVVERTRELGIMRAIGATPAAILKIVVSEGMMIGLVSWLPAVALSLPLSWGIGVVVGNLAFKTPLTLTVSGLALGLWLVLVLVIAIVASAIPAQRASRIVVREALAFAG
ncbi:MAG: FtsX-like permease family protein [Rhodospirillales bacterium]|nr:FtsX-like permease family protein [Rhodospirillales bacterium]